MSRNERLVFVDPEDEEIPYWWPAIIVPEEEYELFKETMDNDAGVNVGENECLVCYFEDGSLYNFSVVSKSSLIPFDPQREPYKSYSLRLKNFVTDAGIRRATNFHVKGTVPKLFKWLILHDTGYLDPGEVSDSAENSRKRVNKSGASVEMKRRGRKPKQKDDGNVKKRTKVKEPSTNSHDNKKVKEPSTNSHDNTKHHHHHNHHDHKQQNGPIESPTPLNPAELIKIEALLSQEIS